MVMISSKSVFMLLLLLGILTASSFDVSCYLYDGETADSVIYDDFTYQGSDYSIVSIGGTSVFLLKNDEIVFDEQEINDVIHHYYLSSYYPDEEEVAEIRQLIDDYNQSRNNGFRFKGKEEYACRTVLFIDGRVKAGTEPMYCRDENDSQLCEYAAKLMFQYLMSVTGMPPFSSFEPLHEPIRDFGYASHSADVVVETSMKMFDEAATDESKMYDAIKYTSDSVPTLRSHAETIEGTIFGWTVNRTCDSTHWCMCPDMDVDNDKLDELELKTNSLLSKMVSFKDYTAVCDDLVTKTNERIQFAEDEEAAEEYTSIFSPLNERSDSVVSVAELAVIYVSNDTLSSKLDRLKELSGSIATNIDARDFSSMEYDLAKYSVLLEDVENLSLQSLGAYNRTLESKKNAEALLLVLSTKNLDSFSDKKLDALKNETSDLGVMFKEGLTVSEHQLLSEGYDNISEQANLLMQGQSKSPVSSGFVHFRGFARKVNTGIAGFVTTTELAEPEEIQENNYLAFGGFSLIVLVTFGAVLTVAFLSILVMMRLHVSKMKYVLIAGFLGSVCLLMVFSALLFFYLNKTSMDANLEEYIIDLESRDTVGIVVDMRSASADNGLMLSCANDIASKLEEKNKSVILYNIYANDNCEKMSGGSLYKSTADSCINQSQQLESVFLMNYSALVTEPEFSTVYLSRAKFSANNAYYASCPLTALFVEDKEDTSEEEISEEENLNSTINESENMDLEVGEWENEIMDLVNKII